MRLNRFLSQCGLGSRRGCEQIILEGRVTIGGKTVTELGTQVNPGDEVSVDGKATRTEAPIVIALNKPKGYICSRADERDRMTIYALLPKQLQTLHHVGRLDKESEGLLLMTNRGDLSHHLIHPSKGAEKEYEVIVDKPVDQAIMAKLVHGMMTEEGYAKAERAWMQTEYRCHLVLKQGLKRQIRLMFYQLGFEVERLIRTRIGWLEVKGLPKAGWKQLTETEVQRFFTEAGTTGRAKPAGESKLRAKPAKGGEDAEDSPAPARRPRATKRPPAPSHTASGRPIGRARYARPLAERADEERSAPKGRGARSGPARRSGPPGRSAPPSRPQFESDDFAEDSAPPRRPSFGARSGPKGRSSPKGRSGPPRRSGSEGSFGDSPRRSGPPRRGGFGDREESSERSGPPRRPSFGDRSGPPGRSGPRRPRSGGDRDESSERAGPPRRSGPGGRSSGPRDRSGPPADRSGPPRRSGPPGRSGPPSRGGPKKPGGRGPRGRS